MPCVVGLAVAAWAHWYIDSQGMAGDPAPDSLWIWTGLTGFALGVAVLGWRGVSGDGWPPLLPSRCVCWRTGLALNTWVGYFPTVQVAWNQLTAGPLPDETDTNTIAAMQQADTVLDHGSVVPVDIPVTASGFKHRTELVYLRREWFATNPPPKLPVVMMIAGEFNTPADWLRTGNAAAHRRRLRQGARRKCARCWCSSTPAARSTTTPSASTACAGNVADHLTKDVVPYVNATFGTSPQPGRLGHRGLVDGRHVRGRPDRDASRTVQQFRRHRGRHGPQRGHQGPDHRAALRRKRRRLGANSTRPR